MMDGPLQWYFLFGIIQNGVKPPVDLRFRPVIHQRLFYHTIEIESDSSDQGRLIQRLETTSVEKITSINKIHVDVINLEVKLDPKNATKLEKLLKRPHFDRLEEQELSGDLRSQTSPFGHAWMLFPSSESLMIPNIIFYEGQQWSVKIIGNMFEIHYELTKIDHDNHVAYIKGRNGTCLNGSVGNRRWNTSWLVDTRSGIIKRMELELDQELSKRLTHKTITKLLTREADDQTIFDYEIDDQNRDDL